MNNRFTLLLMFLMISQLNAAEPTQAPSNRPDPAAPPANQQFQQFNRPNPAAPSSNQFQQFNRPGPATPPANQFQQRPDRTPFPNARYSTSQNPERGPIRNLNDSRLQQSHPGQRPYDNINRPVINAPNNQVEFRSPNERYNDSDGTFTQQPQPNQGQFNQRGPIVSPNDPRMQQQNQGQFNQRGPIVSPNDPRMQRP